MRAKEIEFFPRPTTMQRPHHARDHRQGLAARILAHLRRLRPASDHRLRIVEQIQLTGKGALTLVMLDNEEYLVGSGPDAVHTILPVGNRAWRS